DAGHDAIERPQARASESSGIHPFASPTKRAQPAATRRAHVGATNLRLENGERESHANALFTGAAGASAGGDCARSAFRRRTQSPRRNQRPDKRSVYRGIAAIRLAIEWDADVEHSRASAGLDSAAAQERIREIVMECILPQRVAGHPPAALDRPSPAGLGLYRSSFASIQRGKHFKEATMYSRIVNCTIDPAKVGEFKAALNNEFLPRIQAQPGFIDKIESLDPATGQFSCMTLW